METTEICVMFSPLPKLPVFKDRTLLLNKESKALARRFQFMNRMDKIQVSCSSRDKAVDNIPRYLKKKYSNKMCNFLGLQFLFISVIPYIIPLPQVVRWLCWSPGFDPTPA